MIQNTFKLDALKTFIFFPEEPSMIIREYYIRSKEFIISYEKRI